MLTAVLFLVLITKFSFNFQPMTVMKKFLIMTLAAIVLGLPAQAQHYRESKYYNRNTDRLDYGRRSAGDGPQAGITYYGLRMGAAFSNVNSDDPSLDGGEWQTGFNVGAVVGIALSDYTPLFFETGLSYIEKGGKNSVSGKKMTYDLNYFQVPIVVKYIYDVDGDFSVQPFFGGYLSLGIGGKIKNYQDREAFSSFSSDAFQRFDGGLRVGCGLGFDMFYADLSYDIGLSNISHDMFDKSHNGCLSLTFGVNF